MYKVIFQNHDFILLKTEQKGLCVIAARDFKINETLFLVPYIQEHIENLNHTQLKHYYLVDDANSLIGYIAFGLCSFLSHCKTKQNVNYNFDYDNFLVRFYTTEDIEKGQELIIDYRYNETEKIEFEEQAPIFLDLNKGEIYAS